MRKLKASKRVAKANFIQLFIKNVSNPCFIPKMQTICSEIVESYYNEF